MIVVAIIALLAAIAVPGFMRARKRSQASRTLNDLRLIDSALDQYAIENNKKTNDPVGVADWTKYVKKGSPLYNTGNSIFGTPYGSQTVDQLPQVSSVDYNVLSDVAGTGFWSPYGPKKSLQAKDYAALGAFRHAMRKLLRFILRFSKELVATKAKLTTEQYDALLAIKGSSGANGVTVGEISEQLQVKHHTAVSLLDRLEARKLATRKRATADKRNVNVQLTKTGASLLARLAAIHHRELQQRTPEIIDALRRLRE